MQDKRTNNEPDQLQTIEMLVGLNVIDDESYDAYRQEMEPLLRAVGGGFGYDFRIEKTLRSCTKVSINRVFTIHFPSERDMETFFDDPMYREIKTRHFERSVSATVILAKYQRSANVSDSAFAQVVE